MSSGERRWWSQFASIPVLLAVFVLFGFWFNDYQKSERAFLRARNLRLVDAVAVHVEMSLSALQGSLRRMASAAEDGSLAKIDPAGASSVTRLREVFRHLPFVKSIEVRPCPAAGKSGKETPPAVPKVEMRINSDRTPTLVELNRCLVVPGSSAGGAESTAPGEQISVKVDLSEILRLETANDAVGQPIFSDIVVATAAGRVASQRDATAGRWVRLPPELMKGEESADKGFQREIEEVVISGVPVSVFRQLVQLPDCETLIVYGLVPAARLRAAARSFPSSIQLLLVLAVVLAALAWPFLRITLSGPLDPLRPRHVAIAGLAAIAVVAIVTLVAVDVVLVRRGLADSADEELQRLSADVKGRFLRELATARSGLEQLPSDALTPDGNSYGRMFDRPQFEALRRQYPYVDELDLVGPGPFPCTPGAAGERTVCQLSKWRRERYATPLIDVATRRYVRDLREGLTWEVAGRPLASQHIRGHASGRKLTVLAVSADPAPRPEPDYGTLPIKTITAEMISVSAPMLPVGYELAIFQEEGDVVYHSVTQNSIDQNIYQELDDARPFRSMEVTVPFTTEYEGRDYRVLLAPIEGTPLRLAVMHDEVVPRAFNKRFITRTVVAGGMLFVFECLLLVATWIRSPAHLAWSWPNPARFGRLLLAFLSVAACAVAVALARWVFPAQALPASVCGVVVGVVSCWYFLDGIPKHALDSSFARVGAVPLPLFGRASRWLTRRVNEGATPETTKFTYLGLLTALLVLLAVLPTLALADLMGRWSVTEELDGEVQLLRQAWAARERTLLSTYQTSNPEIADLRRDNQDDLYTAPDFDIKVAKACPATPVEQGPRTAAWLSLGEKITRRLTTRAVASTIPIDDLDGSYPAGPFCTKALIGASVSPPSDRQRFISGTIPGYPPIGSWRALAAAIPLLFAACWGAVAVFRRRVDGFLDEPSAPEAGLDLTRPAAELWGERSEEERDVLAIVARGTSCPRAYQEAATRLAGAGLIKFAPLPSQVLPQLERYTRSAAPPMVRSAHGFHGLAWRPIFSLLLLTSAVFIYFTQGSGSLAFVTALAGIVPHLEHLAALANLTPGGPSAGPPAS
jgi:hypothetical protein